MLPDLGDVRNLLEENQIVPVYKKFTADTITPVSAYLALTRGAERRGYLLESVEKGDQISRYSFLGVEPAAEIYLKNGRLHGLENFDCSASDDPFKVLQEIINNWNVASIDELPGFTGGLVGYFGYETINFIEPTVPVHAPSQGFEYPGCHLFFVDTTVIFDHIERSVYLVGHLRRGNGKPAEQYREVEEKLMNLKNIISDRIELPVQKRESVDIVERVSSNFSSDEYQSAVCRVKQAIQEGETFQVVISQRFELEDHNHPFNLYRRLRGLNPSPYMFYFDFEDFQLVGASPEMLVQKNGDEVHTRPIAGTRRRGKNSREDQRLAADLLNDEKEKAEHTMLVDLGRNDLGRVCRPGSVRVTEQAEIEKYSHVMHMVSDVEGIIRNDCDAVDLFRATFPAGTVSGAPKVRAMQIINECEPDRRGPYSGSVGFFSFNGDLNSCIIIRTIVKRASKLQVQAGAGIVADSKPAREYEETREKARALLKTVQSLPEVDFI